MIFLKDAFTHGLFPFTIGNQIALGEVTDRYLAVPNTFLSPQAVLLTWLDPTQFVWIDILIMYTAGFLGLDWIRRKFQLSPLAFTALFLLFNFNGHIVSHLSVGHFSWGAYFLLPWFAVLVFQMLEGDHSWAWVAKVSIYMLAVFLQGAFHLFLYQCLFLGMVGLVSRKHFWTVMKALFFSAGICMIRWLPPLQLLNQFGDAYGYMGSYPSPLDILYSIVLLPIPGSYTSPPRVVVAIGSWEFDLYVGLMGLIFLFFFGIYLWLARRKLNPGYLALALPMLVMTILSLEPVFTLVYDSPIPIFHGERVATRIIIIPFFILVIIATIQFQRWLERTKINSFRYIALLAGLGVLCFDLWRHFQTWQIAEVKTTFDVTRVIPSLFSAATHLDLAYYQVISTGLIGSTIALWAIGVLVWIEKVRGYRPWRLAPVFAGKTPPAEGRDDNPADKRHPE